MLNTYQIFIITNGYIRFEPFTSSNETESKNYFYKKGKGGRLKDLGRETRRDEIKPIRIKLILRNRSTWFPF